MTHETSRQTEEAAKQPMPSLTHNNKHSLNAGPSRSPLSTASWLVYFLFAALLLFSARGDLWLDEIGSLRIAREAGSMTEILTHYPVDNNHPLNTLFLFCVRNAQAPILFRLFSICCGVGSLFFVGLIAKREWGRQESLCSILLCATSFPLVLYFSEARGYAPALLFALISYALLRANLKEFTWTRAILFWCASILGILSHATFIIAWAAFAMMNAFCTYQGKGPRSKPVAALLAHQLPPALFFLTWYVFFLQHIGTAGGPIYTKTAVLMQASALLLGFPESLSIMALGVLCICVIGGILLLIRDKNLQWSFYLSVLILCPAGILIGLNPSFFYFRFFLVCFPFFYLLFAFLLCKFLRRSTRLGRWLISIGLGLFLIGQLIRIQALLTQGRGHYSEALSYIVQQSKPGVIRIGSDHDFRNKELIQFYARQIKNGQNIRYIKRPGWIVTRPDWIVVHSQEPSYHASDSLIANGTLLYVLQKEFRFSSVSGWNWFVYQFQEEGL